MSLNLGCSSSLWRSVQLLPRIPCQHPSSSQQFSSVCVFHSKTLRHKDQERGGLQGLQLFCNLRILYQVYAEGVLLHRNVVAVSLFHAIWRGDLGRLLTTTLRSTVSNVTSYPESLWLLCKMFSMTLKRMCVQQFCSAVSNRDITPNVGLTCGAPHSCILTCSVN